MTNTLATAQQTLAQLRADTMREEKHLGRMLTAEVDHFQKRINLAVPAMTGVDLHGLTPEAGTLAAMWEGCRL